jgi:hypothetical protein
MLLPRCKPQLQIYRYVQFMRLWNMHLNHPCRFPYKICCGVNHIYLLLLSSGRAEAVGEEREVCHQPVECSQPGPLRNKGRCFSRKRVHGGYSVDAGLSVGPAVRVHTLVHCVQDEKAEQVQLSNWEEAHAASGKYIVRQT